MTKYTIRASIFKFDIIYIKLKECCKIKAENTRSCILKTLGFCLKWYKI